MLKNNILEEDIFEFDYFIYTYLSIHLIYNHNIVFFTSQNMIPSTLCNLNCEKCLNFNPYLKENIIDELENIKQDIDIFFNRVDCVYRFQISGGEPFLYPMLDKVLEYIYLNYKSKIIRLETVTNGTIIPVKAYVSFEKL